MDIEILINGRRIALDTALLSEEDVKLIYALAASIKPNEVYERLEALGLDAPEIALRCHGAEVKLSPAGASGDWRRCRPLFTGRAALATGEEFEMPPLDADPDAARIVAERLPGIELRGGRLYAREDGRLRPAVAAAREGSIIAALAIALANRNVDVVVAVGLDPVLFEAALEVARAVGKVLLASV